MYTILVNDDNSLTTSVKQRIMHRSTMVDNLRFLVNPTYNGHDMSVFTCTLEYVLPISKEYTPETLILSQELYKDKLEYTLPLDTKLTSEPGSISLKLTFTNLEMDETGKIIERVRKTESVTIEIIAVEKWSDYIPSANLDPIVEMLLIAQREREAIRDYAEQLHTSKLDDIVLDTETNEIYGVANGQRSGEGFSLIDLGDEIAEETEVVKVVI